MIDRIKEVALNEINEQSLELTKQFLKVNNIKLENNAPFIEDIIINKKEDTAEVYFPIDDENYYFVIYIDNLLKPRVIFCGMSAGNDVYFIMSSDSLGLEELKKGIDLEPTELWEKGKQISRSNSLFYQDSGMTFNLESKKTGDVENKLKNLLNWLETVSLNSNILQKEIYRQINIVYYGYKDQMWGIHLDPRQIDQLSKLNIHVGIDLYSSGPDLNKNLCTFS